MTPAELTAKTPLPRLEAERLLAHAMRLPRLKAMTRSAVPGVVIADYRRLVARRTSGEPLQYIEGSVPFGPIDVKVDPRVLIPRTETEQLFAIAAGWDDPAVIVDCCTGSGCLGIALAVVHPESDVHLIDLSADACDVARDNAAHNGVDVSVWQGDLFAALPEALQGQVDLFVANPPYVSDADMALLDRQVSEHEPGLALAGGADGLDVIRRIADGLGDWLAPGGRFAIEIGHDQAEAAAALFSDLGGRVVRDSYDRTRFVLNAS
jgi:release factor glutamine methyltransferase